MADLVRALHGSNMSYEHKSGFRRWLDDIRAGGSNMIHGGGAKPKVAIMSDAMQPVKQVAVGGLTTLGLAALHVEKGLDYKEAPLDLLGGVAVATLGAFIPHDGAATTARDIGAAGIDTFIFRRGVEMISAAYKKKGRKIASGSVAGDFETSGVGARQHHEGGQRPLTPLPFRAGFRASAFGSVLAQFG